MRMAVLLCPALAICLIRELLTFLVSRKVLCRTLYVLYLHGLLWRSLQRLTLSLLGISLRLPLRLTSEWIALLGVTTVCSKLPLSTT